MANALLALTDHSPGAPTVDEVTITLTTLVVTAVHIVVAGLAIWGAVTYHFWPVKLSLGVVAINICLSIVVGTVQLVQDFNTVGLILLPVKFVIQDVFFWTPMHGFLKEFERDASSYEATAVEEPDADPPVNERSGLELV